MKLGFSDAELDDIENCRYPDAASKYMIRNSCSLQEAAEQIKALCKVYNLDDTAQILSINLQFNFNEDELNDIKANRVLQAAEKYQLRTGYLLSFVANEIEALCTVYLMNNFQEPMVIR